MSCCVRTPQETCLENGILETNTDPRRERNFRRLDSIRKSPIYLCTDRAKYFTESMKETEDLPMSTRYAFALKHMAEKMPVYISEDELVVGRVESRPGRCGTMHPEVDGGYINLVGGEKLCDRSDAAYTVPPEDALFWQKKLLPTGSINPFQKHMQRCCREIRAKSFTGRIWIIFIISLGFCSFLTTTVLLRTGYRIMRKF